MYYGRREEGQLSESDEGDWKKGSGVGGPTSGTARLSRHARPRLGSTTNIFYVVSAASYARGHEFARLSWSRRPRGALRAVGVARQLHLVMRLVRQADRARRQVVHVQALMALTVTP
jgi:hypothetical protein